MAGYASAADVAVVPARCLLTFTKLAVFLKDGSHSLLNTGKLKETNRIYVQN